MIIGVKVLVGKTDAYFMTGWAASLSDFAASVVRRKPAAPNFLYGYEGITFFSAGFAGAMIILARVWILVATSEQGMAGLKLEPPGSRRLLLLVGGVIKCGAWLVLAARRKAQPFAHPRSRWQTRPHRCLTSFAVAAGLGLAMLARWKPFDPLIAIAVAGNIVWSGDVWHGAQPLACPIALARKRESTSAKTSRRFAAERDVHHHHGVRFRTTGCRRSAIIDHRSSQAASARHVTGEADRIATALEECLPLEQSRHAEVITHLESLEDHEAVLSQEDDTGPSSPFRRQERSFP